MFRVEHISKGSWYEAPNRELNAVHGRWISPDPAGLGAGDMTNPQSWNRYAYVENDPLSAIDATGLGSDCPGGPNRNRSCNFHKPGGPDCVWDGVETPCSQAFAQLGIKSTLDLVILAVSGRSQVPDSSRPWNVFGDDNGTLVVGGCDGCITQEIPQMMTVYPNIGLLSLLAQIPLDPATASGSPKDLIERANRAFVKSVTENALAGVATGALKTLSDASKDKDGPSTTETLANFTEAALDVQKEALGENPLADLSPNYQGLFHYGDPGVDPANGALVGW